MPDPLDQALQDIEIQLAAQNERFEEFVEVFRQLPMDTRLEVSPEVFDAVETQVDALSVSPPFMPLSALRA